MSAILSALWEILQGVLALIKATKKPEAPPPDVARPGTFDTGDGTHVGDDPDAGAIGG